MARTSTSTQIRNMYCDASYMNLKFYNVDLSLKFAPFKQKSPNGMNTYDQSRSITTTTDYEGAFALYKICQDILTDKMNGMFNFQLPVNNGMISVYRNSDPDGMNTYISLTKDNQTIPFKFGHSTITINENGQSVTKRVETGLGVFMKTIEGYLTGINADRHLNNLTDDYVKAIGGDTDNKDNAQQQHNNPMQYNNRGGYQNNRRKSYNNNWNNNRQQYQPQQAKWNNNNHQNKDFSNYNLGN